MKALVDVLRRAAHRRERIRRKAMIILPIFSGCHYNPCYSSITPASAARRAAAVPWWYVKCSERERPLPALDCRVQVMQSLPRYARHGRGVTVNTVLRNQKDGLRSHNQVSGHLRRAAQPG